MPRRIAILPLAWMVLFLLFLACSARVYLEGGGSRVAAPNADARRGLLAWQARNCQGCHQLYGLGGYLGPDLTNVYGARGKDYLTYFIRHGGIRMPAYAVPDDEIAGLVEFLAWVDASGRSRVPPSAVHWSGTYVIARD